MTTTPSILGCVVRTRLDGPERLEAYAELFKRYEQSILAWLRARPLPPGETLEDVKQRFFERALDPGRPGLFANFDPKEGGVRAWLSTCVRNFAKNLREKSRAQLRNSDLTVALEDEVPSSITPEAIFERSYALATVLYVLDRQRTTEKDKVRFDAARRFLPGHPSTNIAEVKAFADAFRLKVGAADNYVKRLRERFGCVLREVVAETLFLDPRDPGAEAAINAELRVLCALLSTPLGRRDPEPVQ